MGVDDEQLTGRCIEKEFFERAGRISAQRLARLQAGAGARRAAGGAAGVGSGG